MPSPIAMLGRGQRLQAAPVPVLQLYTWSSRRLTGIFLRWKIQFCFRCSGCRCYWPHSCYLIRSKCVFLVCHGIDDFLNASKG